MYTCQYKYESLDQTYTLTISALYCGTQRGSEANATIHLQGIGMDLSCTTIISVGMMNMYVTGQKAKVL